MLLRSFRKANWTRGEQEGARDVRIGRLFDREEGATRLALRILELGKGGCLPHHATVVEQEFYVLGGSGTVKGRGGKRRLQPGDAILIPPGELHQLRAGRRGLQLLCATPILGQGASNGNATGNGTPSGTRAATDGTG